MKQTFLKTFFLSALAVLASVPAYALDGYSMQIADFEIKAGETKKVEISMDNATEISALSLEMRLPQGFTVGTDKRGNPAVTQTERAYDQMLKANLDGQVLKVATLSNEAYDGNSGAVLVVPIVAGGDVKAGSYTVSLYNVKFSSPQGKLYDVGPSSCKATVPATLVESIAFANAEESLRAGETLTLSPTVMPSNATTKALAWTSDNEEAATVADGVVKGVSPGEAVITATATDGSGVSASCKVTVTPGVVKATSITMSQTEATVEAGHSLTLTATVMPHDVTNPAVVWRTSSREIATVKDGVVTTLKAGSVTITAETADGTNLKAYCTLTVTKPAAVDYLVVDDFTTNPGKKAFTCTLIELNAESLVNTIGGTKDAKNNWEPPENWEATGVMDVVADSGETLRFYNAKVTGSDFTNGINSSNVLGLSLNIELLKNSEGKRMKLFAKGIDPDTGTEAAG